MNRILREKLTIEKMIRMFCKNKHTKHNENLCQECSELLSYSLERISKCKFQNEKPICSKCEVHCYKKSMNDAIKEVMRYSGPRMVLRSPFLTLMHFIDSKK